MRIVSEDDAKELGGPGIRLSLKLKSRVTAEREERRLGKMPVIFSVNEA